MVGCRLVALAIAVLGCGTRSTIPLDLAADADAGASPTECNGAPRRLDVDPANCGACGHDCLGGTCAGGRCVSARLGRSSCANALALDATSVWWTDPCDGAIFRAPKSGGPRQTFAAHEPQAMAIALTADRAFWTVDGKPGRVRSASLAVPAPLDVALGDDAMPWLVLDDDAAYWATAGGAGAIRKVGRRGGPITTLADHQGFPAGLARSGDLLLWPDVGGTVGKIATAGGAPSVLVAEESHPSSIAADALAVYWTDADDAHVCGDGSVRRADPHASSPHPTTLATRQRCASTIALDDASVYWSTHEGGASPCAHGTIARVGKSGGATEVLASGAFCVGAIVVDAQALYWIATHEGTTPSSVMRLAK